jgi:hypothetical protein
MGQDISGVGKMRDRHHTPDGLARLAESAIRMRQSPEFLAKLRAIREEKNPWPARLDELREMAAKGLTLREMGRHFKCSSDTVKNRAAQYGIDVTGVRLARIAAGAEVLRRIYHLPLDPTELWEAYTRARGPSSADAMHQHADRLGLKRPENRPRPGPEAARAGRIASMMKERNAIAERMQALCDQGLTLTAISQSAGVSYKRLLRMKEEGLLRVPPRVVVPKVKPAPKPRPVKAAPPKKPKALPKSWVRDEKPATPKRVFESVEAWLAAGNQIKQCPAVMVTPTPNAQIADADKAAIAAIYAERDAEERGTKRGDAVRRMMRLRAKIKAQSMRMQYA